MIVAEQQEYNMILAFATSDFYQLLSCSLQYPSEELAEALLEGSFKEDSLAILHDISCNENDILAAGALFKRLEEETENKQCLFEDMRKEYTRLFNHPKEPSIFIYESFFHHNLTQDHENPPMFFLSPTALDVERCYSDSGVQLKNQSGEPPDYMPTELEFMMYLYGNKGRALLDGGYKKAENIEQHIEQFEKQHLCKWGYAFFDRLYKESEIVPYKAIALVGKIGLNKVLEGKK